MGTKNHNMRWVFGWVAVLFLTACAGAEVKGAKPADDWTRSVRLGEAVAGSIGLYSRGAGELVHLVWPFESEAGRNLLYVQLEGSGRELLRQEITDPGHMRTPRLLPAGPESLHLFWVSRPAGEDNWGLWHVLLDSRGLAQDEPTRLSEIEENVGKFSAASDGAQGAWIVWDRGQQGALRLRRLGPEGMAQGDTVLLAMNGEAPSLQVDSEGVAHVAWLESRSFYYAEVHSADLSVQHKGEVVNLSAWGVLGSLGDVLEGPVLGLSEGWVYLFWSILSLSDTEAGTAIAEYIAFPVGTPAPIKPIRILTVPAETQPYVPVETGLRLTELSMPLSIFAAADEYGRPANYYSDVYGDWVDVVGAVSELVMSPAAMSGEREQLVVAWTISQEQREASQLQIAATVFFEGEYLGYTIAGKTRDISDDPAVVVDQTGNLHVAWREGAMGRRLHYATTNPAAMGYLDRVNRNDVFNFLMEAGLEGFTGIMLFPLTGLGWLLPGLVMVGLWWLFRGQRALGDAKTWGVLAAGVVLFFAAKLIFLPTILTYVPFSAWVRVPADLSLPLRLGIPLLIFGMSLWVARRFQFRYSPSPVVLYLAITVTDSLLTLAIYGVNFMRAF